MQMGSSAFQAREEIPSLYTCEGKDISPPLHWTDVPPDARTLALIVDDPDAPDPKAPKRTWVHWVLFNVPPTAEGLAENVAWSELPPGTRVANNDWGKTAYGGPCPPVGRHRYIFKLYALDCELDPNTVHTKADLEKAMVGHVLAEAQMYGTYQKKRGRG